MKKKTAALCLTAVIAGAAAGTIMLAAGAALADDSALYDAAPSSGSAVAPAPHEQLHDLVDDPVETIRDIGDSRKVGWPAFAAAIVLVLCKLAGRAKGRIKWLGEGWRPVAFTVLTAAAGGVYDAAVLGGTGTALILALIVAAAAAAPNQGPAPNGFVEVPVVVGRDPDPRGSR